MGSTINSFYRNRDEQLLRGIVAQANIRTVFEFSSARNRVFNTLPEPHEEELTDQLRLSRDLIEIMRRTT
jgi:hypothetical protein